MKRTEVIDIINGCGLSPNKRLGQNFLVSDIIADRITESVGAGSSDILLEIGPGLGALTGRLLEKTGNLTAVEIDSGLAHYLDERFGEKGNFTLIHGDFLKEKIEGIILLSYPTCLTTARLIYCSNLPDLKPATCFL